MVAGRPQEYDRVKIANDLIEWAKRSDSINLNKFCAYNDPIISPHAMLRWCREDDKFRTAYEKAKTFLAFRREEQLSSGELHAKAYDLNATVYDQFHRAEKIELDDLESARKQKEAQAASKEEQDKANAVVEALSRLQAQFCIDESSSPETKP
jgi:hypothetical protein